MAGGEGHCRCLVLTLAGIAGICVGHRLRSADAGRCRGDISSCGQWVWVVSSRLGAVRWGRLRVSASIAAEGTWSGWALSWSGAAGMSGGSGAPPGSMTRDRSAGQSCPRQRAQAVGRPRREVELYACGLLGRVPLGRHRFGDFDSQVVGQAMARAVGITRFSSSRVASRYAALTRNIALRSGHRWSAVPRSVRSARLDTPGVATGESRNVGRCGRLAVVALRWLRNQVVQALPHDRFACVLQAVSCRPTVVAWSG